MSPRLIIFREEERTSQSFYIYSGTGLTLTYCTFSACGTVKHRRISLIEDNAKSQSFCLKSKLQKDFVAAVYLFEVPSLPRFFSWGDFMGLNLITDRV